MQKITPHLWFDTQAVEAAHFYVDAFGHGSKVKSVNQIPGTPSGDVDIVSFRLFDLDFEAISAGPYFKFNPSISFMVTLKTVEEVNALWDTLISGGSALMEIDTYPWSERYGWLRDKYGLTWQLMKGDENARPHSITPSIMFVGPLAGRAEEAMDYYCTIFKHAEVGYIMRYDKGQEPDKEGTIAFASFTLEGQSFAAMDSAHKHEFEFNEAVSLIVHCKNQEEIDYYWSQLSADPAAEQCGWLKDKFGLSWQIVPEAMGRMLATRDPGKLKRVTEAFLKMKKFDLAVLEDAFKG